MATDSAPAKPTGDRWTIISVGVALALLLVMQMGQTRGQVAGLRGEIAGVRGEIANLGRELRGEIGGLRAEFRSAIDALRTEFRAELKSEIGVLRGEVGELRGGVSGLAARLSAVEVEQRNLRGGQAEIVEGLRLTNERVANVEAQLGTLRDLPQLSSDWRDWIRPEGIPYYVPEGTMPPGGGSGP